MSGAEGFDAEPGPRPAGPFPPGYRKVWTFGTGARPAGPHPHPVTRAILWSCVAVFLVQVFYFHSERSDAFDNLFSLSREGVAQHRYWQFVTYAWLHSETILALGFIPIHIVFNLLMVRFLAPELELALGRARFLVLYLGSVVAAGAAWLLWDGARAPGTAVLGASGAVFGLMTAYACYDPRRQLQVWVLFVLPIRTSARTLVLILVGNELLAQILGVDPVSALMGLFFPISSASIGHSAHLGGALFGFVAMMLWRRRRPPVDPALFSGYHAVPQDTP